MTVPRVFLIDGTSGVWKEELIDYVDHVLVSATVVRKISTRGPRDGEDFARLDLEQVDDLTFTRIKPDYQYEYGGFRYGIQRARIDEALKQYASVFVIVRNAEVIEAIRRQYHRCCPTSAFVYMDRELVAKRLARDGGSAALQESAHQAFLDYMRHPDCYDEVILNAGVPNDFFRLIDILIRRGSERSSHGPERGDERKRFVLATSRGTRRLLQLVCTAVSSVCVAFAVNMLTGGPLDYWRVATLVFDLALLAVAAAAALVLLLRWNEID